MRTMTHSGLAPPALNTVTYQGKVLQLPATSPSMTFAQLAVVLESASGCAPGSSIKLLVPGRKALVLHDTPGRTLEEAGGPVVLYVVHGAWAAARVCAFALFACVSLCSCVWNVGSRPAMAHTAFNRLGLRGHAQHAGRVRGGKGRTQERVLLCCHVWGGPQHIG